MKVNALELFEQDFKEGDEVVIVNDLDLLDWGVLTYGDKGFWLTSGLRPKRYYTWHQCIMMAHDGFPVRKIFGRFPKGQDIINKQIYFRAGLAAEVIEQLQREVTEIKHILKQYVRYNPRLIQSIDELNKTIVLLHKESAPMQSYWTEDMDVKRYNKPYDKDGNSSDDDSPSSSIRFGCPFEIDKVRLQLYNPGCCGSMYDLTPQEETLRMISKDGLIGQLWQLDSVFDFDVKGT